MGNAKAKKAKSKNQTAKTTNSQVPQKQAEKTAPRTLTPEIGAALFEDARSRLEDVFNALDIHADAQARLMQPSLSLQVSIPVRMDDGSLKAFPAWRVHYDTSLGPAKGGGAFSSRC